MRPRLLYAAFTIACLAAVTYPAYPAIAGAITTPLFGLPFPIAWHVLWVAGSFLALLFYDRAVHGGREE